MMKNTISSARRGSVLLLVLVAIAILSLAGYTFTELMLAERKAAEISGQKIQAQAAAESGVEYLKIFLAKTEETQNELGGSYDNSTAFRGLVADDASPKHRTRFTIVSPVVDSNGLIASGVRCGLQDESSRLNLKILMTAEKSKAGSARTMLLALPGMDELIADAILDWIDEDSEAREYGAETDVYASLATPYAPKNGPLQTIEELLLVQGVQPLLLFGSDANRNGRIDAGEPDPTSSIPNFDNADGSMNQGWASYLTLYSAEKNVTSEGAAKIDLNDDDLQKLYDSLSSSLGAETATFVVAYRQNGAYSGSGKASTGGTGELDMTKKSKTTLKTILDLVGAKTQVTFKGEKKATVLASPIADLAGAPNLLLQSFMDTCSVGSTPPVGRININQASKVVLMTIPGMTTDLADQIISKRILNPLEADTSRKYETWIMDEGIVDLKQMKEFYPYVTGGGSVFRAQVVGYFDEGGPAVRLEVVIDATKSPPSMVFWRDISHLGRGYSVEVLGTEAQ
jgi:DNA uptake protein ComE-like DNA-binding protein/type II secretory pathway component PulJ